MRKKIRIGAYVYEDSWNALDKCIDCSKSEWICNQVEKRVNQIDDVAEIERQMREIKIMIDNLGNEFDTLSDKKEQLLKQRTLNEQNFEIINQAMNTIRLVANNQGFIEKTRVEFIANKFNLKASLLIEQIEKENIDVKDFKTKKQDNDYSATGSKQRK